MATDKHLPAIGKLKQSILKVLGYFDLFHYPVSTSEIFYFLDTKIQFQALASQLFELETAGILYRFEGFYSLRNDPGLVKNRQAGSRRAAGLLSKARRISGLLYCFPFVRTVCISGSLSKHMASEREDIDYFIITATGRLWIARTLMHCLKKLSFLSGRQHWLCMNYYLDEEALIIEEKNIFTATELTTLIPTVGKGTFGRFMEANQWVSGYFPNQHPPTQVHDALERRYLVKRALEFLFRNRFGEILDNYLMRVTGARWGRKEKRNKINGKGDRMGLLTGKHFAKPRPEYFQQRLLSSLAGKLSHYEARWQEILTGVSGETLPQRNDIVISGTVPGPGIS